MKYDYRSGAVISPDAPADSLEAKAPYIDNGTSRRDPSRYYSKDFMQREWEDMWARSWLIAGVSSDLRRPGAYFTFDIGGESILVVRTKEGAVNAFYNVCPHRGNRLVLNERGTLPAFSCSFHSWRFNHQGEALEITDRETFRPQTLQPCPSLTALACEEHAGLVFICMNPEPPPLEQAIGLPPDYLPTYEIDKMVVVRHVSSEWAANWKIGVDAFYESYHLHAVHPETSEIMGDLQVQYDLYPNGASRMIVPFGQVSPRHHDQLSVNDGLKSMLASAGIDPDAFSGTAADVREALHRAKRARAEQLGLDYSKFTDYQLIDSWATGIFPNVQIGCHPEGVFLMRFLPHPQDPERFYYDNITMIRSSEVAGRQPPDWFGLPEGTDTSGNTRPATEHVPLGEPANLGLVLDQDSFLLPYQQKGVRSRGFKGAIFSEQEARLRHFHTELDRYLEGKK